MSEAADAREAVNALRDEMMRGHREMLARMQEQMELSRDHQAALTEEPVTFCEAVNIDISDGMSISELLASIGAAVEKVPAEFRDAATVDVTEDDGLVEVRLEYRRPETAKEEKDRKMRAARHNARVREQELAALAALQAKYGPAL